LSSREASERDRAKNKREQKIKAELKEIMTQCHQ
jgi:hypothetical protein